MGEAMICADASTGIDVAILVTMRKLSAVEGRAKDMRRDMDLVRTILRTIQAKADLKHSEIKIEGHDELIVGRHIAMLYDAGYIEGVDAQTLADPYKRILVTDLTWQGHEFAGALLTDEGVWEKVKAAFGPEKLATVPLKMIETVATQALTAWGLKQIGLG